MAEIDLSGFGDGRNSSYPVLYICSMPFTLWIAIVTERNKYAKYDSPNF